MSNAPSPTTLVSDGRLRLRAGDVVEVRSAAEIRATLDDRGELDDLPFMPEMLAWCGRTVSVHKVAHKVCDAIGHTGMRRMDNAVYLTGARCDGAGHGGCQTACQFLWREQWLRRPGSGDAPALAPESDGRILLPLLVANARKEPDSDGAERFSCQATEILRTAPTCLPFRDVSQYVRDVTSGNVGVPWALRAFLVGLFNRVQNIAKKVLPRALWFRDGLRWGFLEGRVEGRTPTAELGLQPGDLVRIRSKEDILATLDGNLHNRGMGFDEEMSRYCGSVARVQSRVTRCIDESTGRMLTMKNPCVVLENTVCAGAFNANCPRGYVPFWREIWLERISS